MYHVKTKEMISQTRITQGYIDGGELLLCPNLLGSVEAPTTAKYLEEKNLAAVASVAILSFF